METTWFMSSACFTASSLPPVLWRSQIPDHRVLSSTTASPGSYRMAVARKNLSFSVKASLRANISATGVPTSVPVRVAHELLLAGHRYLDVRTPEEFSAGHAVGAINIPYMYKVGSGMTKNPNFLKEVSAHFGKYDEIIVGCQLGKRSMMAAVDLLAAGYNGVTDIAGRYAAWTQNGLPTE